MRFSPSPAGDENPISTRGFLIYELLVGSKSFYGVGTFPNRNQNTMGILLMLLLLFSLALGLATTTMLTRCAFRVAELSEGFKGHIWYNEVDYMVLEGAMISICVLMLTFGHPGLAFGRHYKAADYQMRIRPTEKATGSSQDSQEA